jgi:hypothetical protein
VKVTEAEEEIIKMMFERIAMGKRLSPMRIKMRRARFIIRNMLKVRYQLGLFDKEIVRMSVNARSFMMGIGYGNKNTENGNPLKLSLMQE